MGDKVTGHAPDLPEATGRRSNSQVRMTDAHSPRPQLTRHQSQQQVGLGQGDVVRSSRLNVVLACCLIMWLWVKPDGTILGVGVPPIFVYFSGHWDVHWGYDLHFDP